MLIIITGDQGTGKALIANKFKGYNRVISDFFIYKGKDVYLYSKKDLEKDLKHFDNVVIESIIDTNDTAKHLAAMRKKARKLGHTVLVIEALKNIRMD